MNSEQLLSDDKNEVGDIDKQWSSYDDPPFNLSFSEK